MTVRELMNVIGGSTVNIFWHENYSTSYVGTARNVPDYLLGCEVDCIIGDSTETGGLIHVIIK